MEHVWLPSSITLMLFGPFRSWGRFYLKDTTEDHVVEAGTCMLPSICSAGILGPGFVPWP